MPNFPFAYGYVLNGYHSSLRFAARSEITPYHGVCFYAGVHILCLT